MSEGEKEEDVTSLTAVNSSMDSSVEVIDVRRQASTTDTGKSLEASGNTIDEKAESGDNDTVELDSTRNTIDETVCLETTSSTIDLVETTTDTVDDTPVLEEQQNNSAEKVKDLANGKKQEEEVKDSEVINFDEMVVLDTAGDESAKVEESTEEVAEKKDLGIYPENPFLASDNSSKDRQNGADGRSQDIQKKEPRRNQTIQRNNVVALDTAGENNKTKVLERETKEDVICIEGVSIDVDGDRGSGANVNKHLSPYPVHEIPSYNTEITGVLSDIEYSMLTGNKIKDPKPKKTCFNCLGDHNVNECPDPPDFQKIAVNRKKIMSTRVSNVRYHEDSDNKYGQLQPGKISDTLRHALGMRQDELPMYIYRMRYLGYPPGWLKEAEVRQADMKMYDGTGQSVSHPDTEEGEAEPTRVKYNPDKLVSFPGFNTPVPRGVRDDCRELNFPCMQENHRKSEFARFMELNKAGAYKKRKLKDDSLKSNGSLNSSTQMASSMEVDDSGINVSSSDIEFNPPLPEEPMPPLPPGDTPSSTPKRPIDVEDGELVEDDSESSIGYLEAKRHALLKQLETSGTQSNDATVESVEEEKDNATTTDNENDTESSTQVDDSENSRSSGPEIKKTQKVKHHRSHSKGFKLGVAIPPSITPFTTLPDPEKWTVDVSDHINFENLPDALGTWIKMKGLVRQVKKRMLELHADDD